MDIFPSRNTCFIPKIFLLPSWKVTCFFSIISSFPQVIQLHVTITRKMSLVLTQEELVTTFHGTRKNKQVLALDSLWLNPKLVGKGFNWHTHLVHFYHKILLYFFQQKAFKHPRKIADHLAHPKTRIFIQRISYAFPENPIFKSKTFLMPDSVPVFDAPPPLPPEKENTFLSRKPPKFSNENTFNVPMKESIT